MAHGEKRQLLSHFTDYTGAHGLSDVLIMRRAFGFVPDPQKPFDLDTFHSQSQAQFDQAYARALLVHRVGDSHRRSLGCLHLAMLR